jgi:hypothetical protein
MGMLPIRSGWALGALTSDASFHPLVGGTGGKDPSACGDGEGEMRKDG